jgi:putative transcriptional regulator
VQGDVFHRSVILMLHHDDDGAQGVVLNKPLAAEVDAVLPGWQRVVTGPPVLFQGGPVSTSSALGLVTVPGDEPEPLGVKRLFGSIGLVDLDVPTPVVAAELAGMRIFAGYSGWSDGQLEMEIRRGDWYIVDAEARDPFTPAPEELWRTVLRRQRDNLAFVANFPDDPSMNGGMPPCRVPRLSHLPLEWPSSTPASGCSPTPTPCSPCGRTCAWSCPWTRTTCPTARVDRRTCAA